MDLYNRNDQICWLYDQADIILSGNIAEISKECVSTIVNMWERRTALPKWYDEVDHGILIRAIADKLNK